jgi:hypothetical protein
MKQSETSRSTSMCRGGLSRKRAHRLLQVRLQAGGRSRANERVDRAYELGTPSTVTAAGPTAPRCEQ